MACASVIEAWGQQQCKAPVSSLHILAGRRARTSPAACACACPVSCRYEVHHGVRISDSALVEAAILSDRYIADRFLPDKAIDLIDESAAKLKMEITG